MSTNDIQQEDVQTEGMLGVQIEGKPDVKHNTPTAESLPINTNAENIAVVIPIEHKNHAPHVMIDLKACENIVFDFYKKWIVRTIFAISALWLVFICFNSVELYKASQTDTFVYTNSTLPCTISSLQGYSLTYTYFCETFWIVLTLVFIAIDMMLGRDVRLHKVMIVNCLTGFIAGLTYFANHNNPSGCYDFYHTNTPGLWQATWYTMLFSQFHFGIFWSGFIFSALTNFSSLSA